MASSSDSVCRPLVLLTGATGYIGGRLLKALEKAGWPVRCLARQPEFLQPRVASNTEVVKADCFDQASLPPAMTGVHTAYYLVHSMGSSGKFEEEDRQAARNFAASARQAGVRRIIYLGGLGVEGQSLSAHLRSRQEVADIPLWCPSTFRKSDPGAGNFHQLPKISLLSCRATSPVGRGVQGFSSQEAMEDMGYHCSVFGFVH